MNDERRQTDPVYARACERKTEDRDYQNDADVIEY